MPRYGPEDLDDDFPPTEPPKRTRSPWLIPGVVAGLLLLVGVVLVEGLFTARQQVRRERDMMLVTRAEAEEARFRAEQAGREPALVAVARVDAQSLAREYGADEVSATEKYTGRRIRCAGSVHAVEKLDDGSFVMSFVDAQMEKGAVRAYFPADEAEKLANFGRGSPVHFGGTCAGWDRTVVPAVIAIRDCHIAPAPPRKEPPPRQDRPR